eukprot:SAG31_NODE_5387_length_2571_cov_6.280744_2_plen_42_part_00
MFDNLKGAGKPLKLDNSDFATVRESIVSTQPLLYLFVSGDP